MKQPETLLIRDHLEWLVQRATDQTRGDIKAAAKLLGVDRGTLSHWVNHGLSKKYYRGAASTGSPLPLPSPSAASGRP